MKSQEDKVIENCLQINKILKNEKYSYTHTVVSTAKRKISFKSRERHTAKNVFGKIYSTQFLK